MPGGGVVSCAPAPGPPSPPPRAPSAPRAASSRTREGTGGTRACPSGSPTRRACLGAMGRLGIEIRRAQVNRRSRRAKLRHRLRLAPGRDSVRSSWTRPCRPDVSRGSRHGWRGTSDARRRTSRDRAPRRMVVSVERLYGLAYGWTAEGATTRMSATDESGAVVGLMGGGAASYVTPRVAFERFRRERAHPGSRGRLRVDVIHSTVGSQSGQTDTGHALTSRPGLATSSRPPLGQPVAPARVHRRVESRLELADARLLRARPLRAYARSPRRHSRLDTPPPDGRTNARSGSRRSRVCARPDLLCTSPEPELDVQGNGHRRDGRFRWLFLSRAPPRHVPSCALTRPHAPHIKRGRTRQRHRTQFHDIRLHSRGLDDLGRRRVRAAPHGGPRSTSARLVRRAPRTTRTSAGSEVLGSPRTRFEVKFYQVAIVFLVFDIETAFLYPWALRYRRCRAWARSKNGVCTAESRSLACPRFSCS